MISSILRRKNKGQCQVISKCNLGEEISTFPLFSCVLPVADQLCGPNFNMLSPQRELPMKFKDDLMRRRQVPELNVGYGIYYLTNHSQWWVEFCVPKLLLTTRRPGNVLSPFIDEELN
jgi:hypothetical protein